MLARFSKRLESSFDHLQAQYMQLDSMLHTEADPTASMLISCFEC